MTIVPLSSRTIHCKKCGRDVVLRIIPAGCGIKSDCEQVDCLIISTPDNQPCPQHGIEIVFCEEKL